MENYKNLPIISKSVSKSQKFKNLKDFRMQTNRKADMIEKSASKPIIGKSHSPISRRPAMSSLRESVQSSFTFSKLCRFENTIYEKFKGRPSRVFKPSAKEKIAQQLRFAINQDMSRYTPDAKCFKIHELNKKYELNKELSRLTKQEITTERKLFTKTAIEEKFRKHEIRIKRKVYTNQETNHIGLAWSVILMSLCLSSRLNRKLIWKKHIRRRNELRLKRFRVICQGIGKFMLLLRIIKVRVAKRYIQVMLLPIIRKWVKNVNEKNCAIICNCCEVVLSKNMIFALMARRRFKVLFIQRSLRYAMNYRKNLYKKVLNKWNEVEQSLKLIKSFKNRKKLGKTERQKMQIIREQVLKLSKQYWLKMIEFHNKVQAYRSRESFFWTAPPDVEQLMKSKPSTIGILMTFSPEFLEALIISSK